MVSVAAGHPGRIATTPSRGGADRCLRHSSSSSHRPRHAPSRACSGPTSWSSRRSGTSATCPGAPTRSRPPTRARSGRASAWTSTTASSRSTSSRPEKKSVVANLKRQLKQADELYLATDEDREGESIAWHLFEVLAPQIPVKRMVFHEITPAALQRAVEEPRELDRRLVDAQEARRILDRLYGYEVSPVLWKKVMPRLSAGRVQSVATRMVVERERARMRFRAATWWGVEGTFAAPDPARRGRHHHPAQLRRRRWCRSTAPPSRPGATSTPTARSSRPARSGSSTRRSRRALAAGLEGETVHGHVR